MPPCRPQATPHQGVAQQNVRDNTEKEELLKEKRKYMWKTARENINLKIPGYRLHFGTKVRRVVT
jgi:hypothetical protein